MMKNSKYKKITIISIVILVVLCMSILLYRNVIEPSNIIKRGDEYLKSYKYDEAILEYSKLGENKKAEAKIKEAKYEYAMSLAKMGKEYDKAMSIYKELNDTEKAKEAKYIYAEKYYNAKKYDDALLIYEELNDVDKVRETKYMMAKNFYNISDYENAYAIFKGLDIYNSKDYAALSNFYRTSWDDVERKKACVQEIRDRINASEFDSTQKLLERALSDDRIVKLETKQTKPANSDIDNHKISVENINYMVDHLDEYKKMNNEEINNILVEKNLLVTKIDNETIGKEKTIFLNSDGTADGSFFDDRSDGPKKENDYIIRNDMLCIQDSYYVPEIDEQWRSEYPDNYEIYEITSKSYFAVSYGFLGPYTSIIWIQ